MSDTSGLEELVPWQKGPTERGGYSIILSCLALVVTCTWTVLHLNLPGISHEREGTSHKKPFGKQWSFPAISWTTLRKAKWTLVMIVFPEFVFAHAVLELRMALDDFTLMYERHEALFLKGWCIDTGDWTFILHDILSGRWPTTRNPFSSTWPWFNIASSKKRIQLSPEESASIVKENVSRANRISVQNPSSQAMSGSGPTNTESSLRYYRQEYAVPPGPVNNGGPWPNKLDHNFPHRNHAEIYPHICRKYGLTSWTLTHVYLANMGGLKVNGNIFPANHLANTLDLPTGARDPNDAGLMTIIHVE
ncbi:MAG: hypothetical protein M1820_007291 [Bogoriella megaspora]|nr:MAG: hypothetical protein M1820_007291 [Bogoriella megaspora]